MRKLVLGVVAAGALTATTAVRAMAQIGIYAGPGGFGVGVGVPGPYYYGGPYYGGPYFGSPAYNGYYDYAPGWGWHGGHWHGHYVYHHHH